MLRKNQYRDMERFAQTKREQTARYRKRTGSGKYQRRKWTAEEEKLVAAHKMPDRELSKQLQRSVLAIQDRRCKLRKEGKVSG